jgi:hypothetical protein
MDLQVFVFAAATFNAVGTGLTYRTAGKLQKTKIKTSPNFLIVGNLGSLNF